MYTHESDHGTHTVGSLRKMNAQRNHFFFEGIMSTNSYSRTTSLRRRIIRVAGLFMLLATMQKAMPVAAAPSFWSVKIARQSFTCQRGIGICIDLFGPDASNAARVSFDVERGSSPATGSPMGRMTFLTQLAEQADTFFVEQDVALDRRRSLELGYQQVTILKGAYPIDRSGTANGSVLVGLQTMGITITIDVGRKSFGCQRFGVCSITIDLDFAMMHPAGGTGSLDGNTLRFDFLEKVKTDEDSSMIYVDEDITLDEKSSLALGAKQVTILKGAYRVDYSDNPNGQVDFAVARIGITVTIDIGRKRFGCTRAGICEISVELDLAMNNPTPAVVSLDGKAMLIDFLGRPSSGREPFVLDDDFVIGRDMAVRLGMHEITLKAGTYELDFSVNPNGRLVIPISSQGIVVTIYVGRPSQGCRGFGFCGITIDLGIADDRSVPAVLTLKDGVMKVDFLAEAPESGDVLTLDDDMTLEPATARRAKYSNVVLKRGSYTIDRSTNAFGTVEIPVETSGIGIQIDFGRTSRCNPGFGICRIIIDLSAASNTSDRTGYAAGETTVRGLMTLYFSDATPFAGDTLFVDEDVPLEGTPSNPSRMVIKRGAYPVDTASTPYGSVTVVTAVEGSASVESTNESSTGLSLWPNPATTSATTSFNLDASASVRLELLDAQGMVVLTAIDNERLEAGSHERTLDLSGLPSGAYFERLTVGATRTVRALQILR